MKWLWPALRSLFAVVVAFFICQLHLDYIESFFYDSRMAYTPGKTLSNRVSLVMVDAKTVEALGGTPKFGLHAEALRQIQALKPFAVVYVSNLKAIEGSATEKSEFASETSKNPRFYHVVDDLEMKGESGKLRLPAPLENIPLSSGPKTADSKILAKDGVTRRMLVNYQDQFMLHPHLAGEINTEVRTLDSIQGLVDLYDSKQVYMRFQKPGSFPRLRFEDVVQGKLDPNLIKDRIVLVGDDLQISHEDYVYTPFSRSDNFVTRTEMHANMFETMIENSGLRKMPFWLTLLLTGLISILTVHVVLLLKPLKGILILGSTAFGFALVSYLLFWIFDVWIDLSHPFLAIFLCYYFFIPYRLIVENRKSWEYFQKNKLLTEVEELKTNFIGMMSHDLKTPLARIHGMTEIIVKDTNPLTSPQREALDMIKQSTEDLTKFITTILNYAKIESQGVVLHLQSQDLNEILKEVVRKNEFLARVKHIQFVLELEPLFSIPVDPNLMKQVFSNLIENAVKYSPEDSKILISSDEKDGKVIIQVADQGMGIPEDDLGHIFMKFFRSRNAKFSSVKGSGLGLYLTRYFVELHNGQIFVESSPGQGSTFTVELPIKTN